MKFTKTLFILSFLFSLSILAQEGQIKNNEELPEGEIVITSIDGTKPNPDGEVAFAIVENPPVHSECDENLNSRDSKKCMSGQLRQLISQNFNINMAGGLGLPEGKVKIKVFFNINKEGEVSNIRAIAPHTKLEEEAVRIIKLIPKFKKPGIHKGEPVTVPYYIPIIFKIEGPDPSDKK